jgi:hypothetical protein
MRMLKMNVHLIICKAGAHIKAIQREWSVDTLCALMCAHGVYL